MTPPGGELISPATRRAFRESLVGEYLRVIEEMFSDEGLVTGPEPGAEMAGNGRRLIQGFFNGVDWTDAVQVDRVLRVFTQIAARASEEARAGLAAELARDGFEMDPATGRIQHRVLWVDDAALRSLPDGSSVRDNLRRMLDATDSDPRLAVSAARALVESTAKLVLGQRGVSYSSGAKLPALVSQAQKSLGLDRADVDGNAAAGDALRKVLGSLTTLTQGLTELRNNVGVDHGRDSVPSWVRPRHARLAGGAAQVWCTLMLETLEDPSAPWRRPKG